MKSLFEKRKYFFLLGKRSRDHIDQNMMVFYNHLYHRKNGNNNIFNLLNERIESEHIHPWEPQRTNKKAQNLVS